MGSQINAPCKDLRVTILSSMTLHPSEATERRSLFLSNIDQVLNFSVENVHFFSTNIDYPVEDVAERLKSVVERLLVPYDFLAGRLRENEAGRLEIDCNGAGVGFLVAASELVLAEIGELECLNPAFRQLALAEPAAGELKLEDQLLINFQVTSFKCGGFTLGISNNHTIFDGFSFQIFLKNVASLAADQPLAITPYTDRHLLEARSPLIIAFQHTEFVSLNAPSTHPLSTMLDIVKEKLESKLLRLSADDISALKEKARASGRAATSFNVVTAHLWRCKVLSTDFVDNPDKPSTLLYAVDIRKRLRPQLPEAYTGNGVLIASVTVTRKELEEGPFSHLVEAVAAGAVRMDDDYVRSMIDWMETHKGIPRGDVFVSPWWKMGYAEVEFPWGRPVYSFPVVHPQRDIVLLSPSIGGGSKGVNLLVALPFDDMERFEDRFYKFLA